MLMPTQMGTNMAFPNEGPEIWLNRFFEYLHLV